MSVRWSARQQRSLCGLTRPRRGGKEGQYDETEYDYKHNNAEHTPRRSGSKPLPAVATVEVNKPSALCLHFQFGTQRTILCTQLRRTMFHVTVHPIIAHHCLYFAGHSCSRCLRLSRLRVLCSSQGSAAHRLLFGSISIFFSKRSKGSLN